MQLTPRIKSILQILLDSEDPVLESEIAEQIGVSKRTIQREIDYVEKVLPYEGLNIRKKKNFGVWLDGEAKYFEQLRMKLASFQEKGIIDKEQRVHQIIFELLRDITPKKLFYFSNLFGVSEATISSDLELAEEWLKKSHVTIVRKPGYGVILKGKEKDYRAALQRFVKENVDDESMSTALYRGGTAVFDAFPDSDQVTNFYDLLNSDILGRVSRTVQEIQDNRLRQMTDNSYIGLILHITIALDRILKDEIIEETETEYPAMQKDEDYNLALKVISRLEEEFAIRIPQVEMDYVLLHIKGSKISYSNPGQNEPRNLFASEILIDTIDQMIDEFDSKTAFELKCDEEFIQGLLIHMEPALIRLKNDLAIFNPVLLDIKNEYPQLFLQCKKASKVISDQIGVEVNDDEIGYLAMHFAAALERTNNRKRSKRVVEIGIICASGFGVARLMISKLRNVLKQEVVLKPYGKDEITPAVISKTDFFISTMQFDLNEVDFLKVSPLISVKDLQQIRVKIEEYSHMPPKVQESDFTRQLDEIDLIISQIKNLIQIYRNYTVSEKISLDELLTEISRDVTTSQQSAALLKADILEREKIMSQIFPETGFALFHCKTKAVKVAGFYTCIPSKGGYFIHPDMKQIKAAIVLLMPIDSNQKIYMDMLGFISSSLIDDKDFLSTIFEGNEEEVRGKLQKILKKYFAEFINKV